jgi:hypothetical protein
MKHLPFMRVARGTVAMLSLATIPACSSSEGTFSVCGLTATITAPDRPAESRAVSPAFAPAIRFHGGISTDSAWRERVVEELTTIRADTTVRVLFVHKTAVVADDRTRITTAGGTIVEEPADWNGIVATFTVAAIRAYAPTAPLDRVIDGHVVRERVLPPCD